MPRLYVAGIGQFGRSCIIGVHETGKEILTLPIQFENGAPKTVLSSDDALVFAPDRPAGQVLSTIHYWNPGDTFVFHRTISVDIDAVLDGSVYLCLEEGEILLERGDVVYLPGVVHGWRATGEMATILCTYIPTVRSADDHAKAIDFKDWQARSHGPHHFPGPGL